MLLRAMQDAARSAAAPLAIPILCPWNRRVFLFSSSSSSRVDDSPMRRRRRDLFDGGDPERRQRSYESRIDPRIVVVV